MVAVVDGVHSFDEAAEVLAINSYELAVLDVDEGQQETFERLPQLRSEDPMMHVLVCSNCNSIPHVAAAMENGADDFILRPIRTEELRIRVMHLCGRSSERRPIRERAVADFGPLMIDLLGGEITLDCEPLDLTPRERSVLRVLIRSNGKIVSKDQIASRVFSLNDDTDPKAIETYIHRLRRKTKHPSLQIETVRGLGYRLRLAENV